ncbi:hypothetical protein PVAP13_9KG439940 [Panicum virgatum]|uniref:Uncharacterized protein n=1 Tax=Panicum virgatum TaxID=38727 RepID=A0A8T0NNE0_PANVG|nr:hypothetical protein PVAP13_9KG439940 [Panicum virgatum]
MARRGSWLPPAAANDGDHDHPKLFFTPDVASSPSGYSFSAWMPGGQVEKLPCAGGVLPEGVLVIPATTRPLHGLVLIRCWGWGGVLRLQPFHRGTPTRKATRHQSAAEDGRAPGREYNHGTFYKVQPRPLRHGSQCGGRRLGEWKAVRLFCLCDGDCELRGPRARRSARPRTGRRRAASSETPRRRCFWTAPFTSSAMKRPSPPSTSTTRPLGHCSLPPPPPPGLQFALLRLTVLDTWTGVGRLCVQPSTARRLLPVQ